MIEWILRPAAWWQFWRPQSGAIGGAIFAVVALIASFALWSFIWWVA